MTDPKRPKRFYKTAGVASLEDAFTVELDGRPIKTPARAPLRLPTKALAAAIAAEWAEQGELLDLQSMGLTRLANVAIDRAPATRRAMAEEVANYAGTDLLCYLAEEPADLRERQESAWRPIREWAGPALGVVLLETEGALAAPQPPASLKAVRVHADRLNDFRLTGLVYACSLFGSALLALAAERGRLCPTDAFALSRIDELYQMERWGEDEQAVAAVAARMRDAETLQTWFRALNPA